jgi:hypothetical protein
MNNITTLILVLASGGLFYTFINPQYQEIKVIKAEVDEYRTILRDASAITDIVEGLEIKYEDFPREEIERLDKAIPSNVDVVRLALDLDTIAARHGISIRKVDVKLSGARNDGGIDYQGASLPYEKATVTFQFVTEYGNFKSFLADLERNLRLADIRLVAFQSTENGLYDHKIVLETYWIE